KAAERGRDQWKATRRASSVPRGVHPGAALPAADLLRLQRIAGNATTGRLVARTAPASLRGVSRKPKHRAPLPPYRVLRDAQRRDYELPWYRDPTHNTLKPQWTPVYGYVKNPSARYLKDVFDRTTGRVGGGFESGRFQYVVDLNGD